MKKTRLYYLLKSLLQLSTQIGWILTLLMISIHLFDVTILCMLVFTTLLCSFMPLIYQNVNLEIKQLNHILTMK